jgi:mycothiol synthase
MERFGLQIMVCPAEMRGEALELLYHKVPSELRDRVIVQLLGENKRGEIDLSGMWVARKPRGRIVGVMLTQSLAGRVAAIWNPVVRSLWRGDDLAAAMVRAAIADFAGRGFRLVQAVVDESPGSDAERHLVKGGLVRVTELLYLERETAVPLVFTDGRQRNALSKLGMGTWQDSEGRSDPATSLSWRSFNETIEGEFRSVLQATYEGSLDMPELEGTRSLDDILESHKSSGRFVPARWRLGHVHEDSTASAILLLADAPGREAWEIIYLGLTPAVRGRGLGRAIVDHALELALDRIPWLEVAVDTRNTPALHLYYSAGFIARQRRTVYLAILPDDTRRSTQSI